MIKKFIKDNKLSLAPGSRNSSLVIIIGYSQYLSLTQAKIEIELSEQIKNDPFIKEELDRLYSYCLSKNYSKYWTTEAAKKAYIF